MSFETGAGWTFSIGTTQAASNQSEYEADSYTLVGEVESIGEFGDERSPVEFLSLSDARVRKARGSANAGDTPITVAIDEDDSGQAAMEAAFAIPTSADEFNFRIRANDGVSTPTTRYFRARVLSNRVQEITTEGVAMIVYTLAINTAILKVAAT